MPGTGGRDYYVITVRGERGPLDRAGLRELIASGEIGETDQVRNAFGRPLGTVAHVLAVPSDRHGTSPPRPPRPVAGRQARRHGPPAALVAAAVLAIAAAVIWWASRPALPSPAQPAAPVASDPALPANPPATPASAPAAQPRPFLALAADRTQSHPGDGRPQGAASDGDPTTVWRQSTMPRDGDGRVAWLRFDTGPRLIRAYSLVSSRSGPQHDPRSWWLVGIRADGSVRVLDARSGVAFAHRSQVSTYEIAEPEPFQAYRLDVIELAQDRSGIIELGDVLLHEDIPPPPSLPAGWSTLAIGNDRSAPPSVAMGIWSLLGGGSDIWGDHDGFRYVHASAPDGCELTARLFGCNGTDFWAKVGLMIRASTDPRSAHVTLSVRPDGGIQFFWRSENGSATTGRMIDGSSLPLWLRLARNGSMVTASLSNNGRLWREAGSVDLPGMGASPVIGLAACSKIPDKPMTVRFDNVTLRRP